jgi:hypothetical protein
MGAHALTEAGQAAAGLRVALAALQLAEQAAQGSGRWKDRHAARRSLPRLVEAADHAQRRRDDLVTPGLACLDGRVASAEAEVARLTAALQRYRTGNGETARRWHEAQRSASTLAGGLGAYRDQLDGLTRPARSSTAASVVRALPPPSPAYGPVTPADRGPSL